MTFTPEVIPDPDQAVLKDTQGQFDSDTPFNVKQAAVSMRRHRWFQVLEIGLPNGPYAITPGLTAGSTQRIQFDNRPDVILVAVSGDTATTGRIFLYLGEVGGPPLRMGQGGHAVVPGPHDGVISIVSRGTTSVYGNIIAMAGYDVTPDFYPGL